MRFGSFRSPSAPFGQRCLLGHTWVVASAGRGDAPLGNYCSVLSLFPFFNAPCFVLELPFGIRLLESERLTGCIGSCNNVPRPLLKALLSCLSYFLKIFFVIFLFFVHVIGMGNVNFQKNNAANKVIKNKYGRGDLKCRPFLKFLKTMRRS